MTDFTEEDIQKRSRNIIDTFLNYLNENELTQ